MRHRHHSADAPCPPVGAAEDLLNRITAIRAAAEILDEDRDLGAVERATFLAVNRTAARRLHHLVGAMTA